MWNDRLDARLLKLKREGYSFAEIGDQIGVTRNAAIGRWQRLNGRVFPSQVARGQIRKEANKAMAKARIQKEAEIVRELKSSIASGADRDKVINQALAAGATYQVVGDALELSKQRIHQIASAT